MKPIIKRFLVTLLTVATLAIGLLATVVFVVTPLHLWWVWAPAGAISFVILQPVITMWHKTFDDMFGLDDMFNDKNK